MYFPREEYDRRLVAIRAAMAKQEIDLLLQFGQEAVCWISGFYTPAYFACAILGVPLGGEAFLVLRSMEVPAAGTTSWITGPLSYRDHEDPFEILRRAVAARGLGRARIGVDKHSWYLTAERYEQLESALPDARIAGDGKMVDLMRVVKSPLEIAMLQQGARIVEAGMTAAIAATAEGVSERDVAAAMAHARIRAGSDLPIDGVLATGERTRQSHGPWTDRKLQRGDQLFYEFHGIRNHYWARMLRSGILGQPTDEQARIAETILAAQKAGFSAIRAGAHVREIDARCREPLIAAGLKERDAYTNRVGYALGLNFRPSPGEFIREFTPQADFRLEEGMVFHMIQSAAGLGFSDTIVVTANGYDSITRFPRQLFIV
jgi:Xaa-Pro dipeptidase